MEQNTYKDDHDFFKQTLNIYSSTRVKHILDLHEKYFDSLGGTQQSLFLEAMIQLIFSDCIHISSPYLDLSIVYLDGEVYQPLTLSALKAISIHLTYYYPRLINAELAQYFNYKVESDTKERILERILIKTFTFQPEQNLDLYIYDKDGSKQKIFLSCDFVFVKELDDIIFSEDDHFSIFGRTLIIPRTKDNPIFDFLVVDPERKLLSICQVTINNPNKKNPMNNVYQAIYDPESFKSLCQNSYKKRKCLSYKIT